MDNKLEERLRSTFAPFLRGGVFIPDSKRVAKLRNPDGPEAADEITRLNAENEDLRESLDELQKAESAYRSFHDTLGGCSSRTGRAWDRMRRAGDKARALITKAQPPVSHD